MAYAIEIPPVNAQITKVTRDDLDIFSGSLDAYRGQRLTETILPGSAGTGTEIRRMSTELVVPVPLPVGPATVGVEPPITDPGDPPIAPPEGAGGYVRAILQLQPDLYWRFGEDSLSDYQGSLKLTCEDFSGNGHTGMVRVDNTNVFKWDPKYDMGAEPFYDTLGLCTPRLNATEGATLDGDGCLDLGDHRFPGASAEPTNGVNPEGVRHPWSHPGGPWDVYTGPEWQFIGDVAAHDPVWGHGAPYREEGFYPLEPGQDVTITGFAFRDNREKAHTLCHGQGLDVVFEPNAHTITVFPPGRSFPVPFPKYEPFVPLEAQPWRRWFHWAIAISYPAIGSSSTGSIIVYINGKSIGHAEWTGALGHEPVGGNIRTGELGTGRLPVPFTPEYGVQWPYNDEELTPEEAWAINENPSSPPGPDDHPIDVEGTIFPRYFDQYNGNWVPRGGGFTPSTAPYPKGNMRPPTTNETGPQPISEWEYDWIIRGGGHPTGVAYGVDILPYPVGGWSGDPWEWPDWGPYYKGGAGGTAQLHTPPFYVAWWDFEKEEWIPPEERWDRSSSGNRTGPEYGPLPWWGSSTYQALAGYRAASGHFDFELFTPRENPREYGAWSLNTLGVFDWWEDNPPFTAYAGYILSWRRKHLPGDNRQHPSGDLFGWPIRFGAGWNGLLDEIAVFRRKLTASEIAYAYQQSKVPGEGYTPPEEPPLPLPGEGESAGAVPTLLPGDEVTIIKGAQIKTVTVDVVEDRSDAGFVRAIANETATPG